MASVMVTPPPGAQACSDPDYADRPINISVPWGPGGGSDQMVRVLAPLLKAALGVEVVVSDIPGGTGVVGMQNALSATPDGYTIGEMSADTLQIGRASCRERVCQYV